MKSKKNYGGETALYKGIYETSAGYAYIFLRLSACRTEETLSGRFYEKGGRRALNEVSVVVPVYNLKDRLPSTLGSLVRQDFEDLEIVVADDASQDGGADCACDILQRSGRPFRVIRHEENMGCSAARNRGFRESSGRYVLFFDGDDMAESNFISSLYRSVNGSGADFASCGYKTLDVAAGEVKDFPLICPDGLSKDKILEMRILNKLDIPHCATLYRRDFLVRNSLSYKEGCSAGEDVEFLTKVLCRAEKFVFLPDCLYIYVQHDGMGSRSGVKEREKKIERYLHSTEAHFRAAEYIKRNSSGKRLRLLAENMMLPLACLRMLSYFAMSGQKERFYTMLSSKAVRRIILASRASFLIKPEIFLRGCSALFVPSLYYKKYSGYAE